MRYFMKKDPLATESIALKAIYLIVNESVKESP